MDQSFVLFRYTMNELSTLVEALEGEAHAIEVWANTNIGLVSANAEDACIYKQDAESYKKCKSSTYCAGTNDKSNANIPSSSYSHISPELVHSDFHLQTYSAPYGTKDCQKDIVNEKKLVMYNEDKVKEASGDLKTDVMFVEPENNFLHATQYHHNKSVPYVGKVCSSEVRKKQDNMKPGAGCIASLDKEFSSCSRDVQNSCTLDGYKLFGVDLQMPSDSREQLNGVFKVGDVETSLSLTNQNFLTEKISVSVEPVNLGIVMCGKLWCSKHAIYPKGRIQYDLFWVCISSVIFVGVNISSVLVKFM